MKKRVHIQPCFCYNCKPLNSYFFVICFSPDKLLTSYGNSASLL